MTAPRCCRWFGIAQSASPHVGPQQRQRQHLLRRLRCLNGRLRQALCLSPSIALCRTSSALSPPTASFSTSTPAMSASASVDSESRGGVSSLRRSVLYLLSRHHYAQAMELFAAHPQLQTVELTLFLAARLPSSDASIAAYCLSLLLRLHSHGLLPITAAEQHFKLAVLRGDVVAAHSLLPVLFPPSCLPSTAAAASVSPPSPLVRMAAVAQLCLLQCWSVLRMRQLTAGGVTQPVLRSSASHASFPLAAHAEAVERERQAARRPSEPAASQVVPEGSGSQAVDSEEAKAARRLLEQELFGQQQLRPQDWPPLLSRCQARAVEWRRAGGSAAHAELLSASPLQLLSPHLLSLPVTSPSSGTAGVSLLDCLLLAEHLRLLASLQSDPRFQSAWRYRATCSVMLSFHLAVLVASRPAARRACALLDAQLAVQATLEEVGRPKSALSLLSLDLVLASWAALLSAHPSASASASSFPLPERYGYQAFLSFFSAASTAASSSSHPTLWPTSETYSALVSASLFHPQLMAATRTADWVRALLHSRERKGSVMSPQLLLMDGAARHLQLVREETSRAAVSGPHQLDRAEQRQQQRQQQEEEQSAAGQPDWQLVMRKAERSDRAACRQLLCHYRQHVPAPPVASSSLPSPLSFSSSHDAFTLLFRCAGMLADVEAARLLWRHALRLHPHPPAELSSAFFLCLARCHLTLDEPQTVSALPPSLTSQLPASPPASLLSLLQLYLSFSPPPASRKLCFRPQAASSSLLLLLLVRSFLSRSRPFAFAFASQPRVEVEQLRRRALLLLEGRGGEDRVRELARELRDAMLRRAWENGDAAGGLEATAAAAAEASGGWDRLSAEQGEEEADALQPHFPQLAFEHLRLPSFPVTAHVKQRIHRPEVKSLALCAACTGVSVRSSGAAAMAAMAQLCSGGAAE